MWYMIYDIIYYMIYGMIYDMIWYDMIWYVWYDMIWYDMVWYDMIYVLLQLGYHRGSSTVHIYTQKVRTTTQLHKQYIEQHNYTNNT